MVEDNTVNTQDMQIIQKGRPRKFSKRYQKTPSVADVLLEKTKVESYPKHVLAFETFYWLGEKRSLSSVARLRFRERFPDIIPAGQTGHNPEEWTKKYAGFYSSIKLWSRKEKWVEWVQKKDLIEQQKRDAEMRDSIIQSTKNLVGYRSLLQQGLYLFSRKVGRTVKLTLRAIDIEDILRNPVTPKAQIKPLDEELKAIHADLRANGAQITSFKEAKEIIELDNQLARIMNEMPDIPKDDKQKLGEGMTEKVERVMELLKRVALDSGTPGINADEKEDAIDAEVVTDADETVVEFGKKQSEEDEG